jgi:hypothetical protein
VIASVLSAMPSAPPQVDVDVFAEQGVVGNTESKEAVEGGGRLDVAHGEMQPYERGDLRH